MLRIVSFLPSATEIACALGLADNLVGITHECDYPPEVQEKPVVVRSVLPLESMTQPEIDAAVSARLREGQSLYQVDENLLRELKPDLIVTQDLCQVCAPSGNELSQALKSLHNQPQVVWMTPQSLEGIEGSVRDLGRAAGRQREAEDLIRGGRARLEDIWSRVRNVSRQPRVFCMEWLDPVFSSGHWVPEMVRIAGGVDPLGRECADSVRLEWAQVREWNPEVLVVMPCGFRLEKVVELMSGLKEYPGWAELAAVRANRVYAVDANSYFARPGPRVVDGTELLAHLFHPGAFEWRGPADAYRRVHHRDTEITEKKSR